MLPFIDVDKTGKNKTGLGMDQEFYFGHLRNNMPTGHTSGDAIQIWKKVRHINFEIIGIYIASKPQAYMNIKAVFPLSPLT